MMKKVCDLLPRHAQVAVRGLRQVDAGERRPPFKKILAQTSPGGLGQFFCQIEFAAFEAALEIVSPRADS